MERLPFQATAAAAPYESIKHLPTAVLLDQIRSAYNAGAFFRTADAVRLERLILCGITAHPPQQAVAKTALGAEERVAWEYHTDSLIPIRMLRARGYQIAAIETSERAVDLFDWRPAWPVCVVFGNEVDGLPPELLEACDIHIRLPMLGLKHSLNVATAGGVVMFELLRKYRRLLEEADERNV
jgi:23S rRNA (guanosine2251-2'-O)-methyltransferase